MAKKQNSLNDRLKYLALDKKVIQSQNLFVPAFLKCSILNVSDSSIEKCRINEYSPLVIQTNKTTKLSRNKVGVPLKKSTAWNDFDLTDPYLYQTSIKYYPLHDPALKTYFRRPVVKRKLMDMNFVSDKDDAYCSVKDFNDYMRCLKDAYVKKAYFEKQVGVGFEFFMLFVNSIDFFRHIYQHLVEFHTLHPG